MRDKFCLKKKRHAYGKDRIVFGIFALIASALFASQAMAIDFDVGGRPLSLKGYINQGVQFGTAGDHYDTMGGFQQALMQALLEAEYHPHKDVRVFATGQFVKDWAYEILERDSDWKWRRFDNSRDELGLYDDYEDVLKEAHVTWTPGPFNFRIGKQIISWGRLDGVRIMDQINPQDLRRGMSDVEFETTIVPIWLAKAEYYPPAPPFLDEFGVEVVFNPNADFIGTKLPGPGNDISGIWAPDKLITVQGMPGRVASLLGAVPSGFPTYGEMQDYLLEPEEPEQWRQEGWEYGLRIKGTFPDSTFFTLNGFYGVDNDYVFRPKIWLPIAEYAPGTTLANMWDSLQEPTIWDNGIPWVSDPINGGNRLFHAPTEGKHFRQKYVGFTLSRDIEGLYIGWLGGVSPLVRCEGIYEFGSTFTSVGRANPFLITSNPPKEDYIRRDAYNWGIGLDWKFKCSLLNPRRYFTFVPQFSHRHIVDYPDHDLVGGRRGAPTYHSYGLRDAGGLMTSPDMYTYSIRMDTWYLHDRLQPFIFYMRDIRSQVTRDNYYATLQDGPYTGKVKSDLWLFKLVYEPNHIWKYSLAFLHVGNDGFRKERGMDHKDNISLTISYQF